MEVLSAEQIYKVLMQKSKKRQYKAMYSSWYEGIVTEPHLMQIPIDDHIVHRGDGVFEAARYFNGKIFEWDAHLARLMISAERIGLHVPLKKNEITEIAKKLIQLAEVEEGILRIFVSRGPGDFSPNPYSTEGAQFYMLSMPFVSMPKEKYELGASAMISRVPAKPGPYAQVKSCNYLPNVMTKKEAIDNKVDFAINFTLNEHVAEGPTENILILTDDNSLLAPDFDYTLRGTTLLRVLEIAQSYREELKLNDVGTRSLMLADLETAREIMMVGTTLGVLPITQFAGKSVGSGMVGLVAKRLNLEIMKLISGID